MGRVANYSSLKIHHPKEYQIYESAFNRLNLIPKFIVRPISSCCAEGQSITFFCKVWTTKNAEPKVTWFKNGVVLNTSDTNKYSKRRAENDCSLIINSVDFDDKGEYTVRAENSYGFCNEVISLNVSSLLYNFII